MVDCQTLGAAPDAGGFQQDCAMKRPKQLPAVDRNTAKVSAAVPAGDGVGASSFADWAMGQVNTAFRPVGALGLLPGWTPPAA